MKNLALLNILIAAFYTNCFGQTSDSLYRKFSFGISYEANLSGRQLIYDESNKWLQEIRNEDEIPKYGFATGLNIRYNLNTKWNIETGVICANRGYTSPKQDLIWYEQNSNFPNKSKTTVSLTYIEIPLKVNYNLRLGKLDVYATTGISLNNFSNKTTTFKTYYKNGDTDKSKDEVNLGFRENTYSILLGFGINVPISKRLLLNIEPIYRQNFVSIVDDKTAREYLYSIGLNTKLFLRMKKKTQ